MTAHNAPPVVYPFGRSSFLGTLLAAIWLAGLCSVVLWWYSAQQMDWRMTLAFFSVLGAGIAVRKSWKSMPEGQLEWNGQSWRGESTGYQQHDGAEHELLVVVDFQSMLLLRLEKRAGPSLWLWVEKTAFPTRWLDFRRAVYSSRRLPTALPQHDCLALEPHILLSSAGVESVAVQSCPLPQAKS